MSYERDKLISLLYRIFQAEKYTWLRDGGFVIPSYETIAQLVEDLESDCIKSKLKNCESGRIRVEYDKDSQTYQYYLNIGISDGT